MLRNQFEHKFNQKSCVIWLTGLSGAGKTTIANSLYSKLSKEGFYCKQVDGDVMRSGLNKNLGFTEDDREENIRRIAEVSKLFVDCGVISINSFITPTNHLRGLAKNIIGKKDFIEVFVNASIETCESRDPKGLYLKARRGVIKDFTGISAPFEDPVNPNVVLKTDVYSIDECLNQLWEVVFRRIQLDS